MAALTMSTSWTSARGTENALPAPSRRSISPSLGGRKSNSGSGPPLNTRHGGGGGNWAARSGAGIPVPRYIHQSGRSGGSFIGAPRPERRAVEENEAGGVVPQNHEIAGHTHVDGNGDFPECGS